MRIKAPDGKTYEVRTSSPTPDTFTVSLDGDDVATFVLDGDHTRVTLRPGKKATEATVRAVADEFVDRGGAPMKIM